MQHQYRRKMFNMKYLAWMLAAFPAAVYADAPVGTQQLADVVVKAKHKISRKDRDATGLGKIVKDSDRLNREQVLGIRDLTRYDPGVSVVEQGNGATGGYAIRGVDKNRVAVAVDGIGQIQAFTVQGALSGYGGQGGSGAINEIEFENIRAVEIEKGAGSADYGSGALGGAVGFTTKDASDFVEESRSWGVRAKTAYGGKNRQWLKSLGAGFSKNGWEGVLVRTERQGRETQPHRDASRDTVYEIDRLDAYRHVFDIQKADTAPNTYFLVEGQDGVAAPAAKLAGDTKYLDNQLRRWAEERRLKNLPLSAAEEEMLQTASPRRERLDAASYTGSGRILPDPMDYRSGSWLAKLGYRFSPHHYLGAVLEDTAQKYDIRDMTEKQYYGLDEAGKFNDKSGVYTGSDFRDGLYVVPTIESWRGSPDLVKGIGLKYSRTKFVDEHHRRKRTGLVYRYENEAYSDNWADKVSLTFDRQKVAIDNNTLQLHCAVYPEVDKSCRASADKPYSYDRSDRFHYREQHGLFQLALEKSIKGKNTKHHFALGLGYDASKAVSHPEQLSHSAARIAEHTGRKTDGYNLYRIGKPEVVDGSVCGYIETLRSRKCQARIIKGSNIHIALSDRFSVGKYFDFSLGGRYDRQNFKTDEELVRSGRYANRSWNGGIVFKPSRHLALSYRISNGFRTPSFQELFGIDIYHTYPKGWQRPELKAEKADNKELGIQWKGDFGFLEVSSFRNRYTDLIAVADQYVLTGDNIKTAVRDYHNAQNMSLQGINVLGKIDWNGVNGKLPEGFYTTLAYNRIKPKSVSNRPGLSLRSYALDAVQPARYILGIGYDQPEGKWGANLTLTYSKGKNPDELKYIAGGKTDKPRYTAGRVTSSWKTADISAYLNIKKYLTLRAGIYNLGNYRYVTWESLRQTAESTANRRSDDSAYGRYAAPGRNAVLSLEMKF